MNGLIRREREINRWMQLRQRFRHLRQRGGRTAAGRRTDASWADRIGSDALWRLATLANFSPSHREDTDGGRKPIPIFGILAALDAVGSGHINCVLLTHVDRSKTTQLSAIIPRVIIQFHSSHRGSSPSSEADRRLRPSAINVPRPSAHSCVAA